MNKKISIKVISLLLTGLMILSIMPFSAFAAGSVTDYAEFLSELKNLETYAEEFYSQNPTNSEGELVLNFIRTGVERYVGGNWSTLAGVEITAFTQYVESQDAKNGTSVMNLRDIVIDNFTLPNGNKVDFGHMFGTMNISYINRSNVKTQDLSGWAGDLCDLLYYCAKETTVEGNTLEQKASYILENCLGVDADDAFGWDDFYGDMDAYYLINEYFMNKGSFSELMEAYFTAELNDSDRAAYFLNNRFKGKTTKDEVREAVYSAYRTNVALEILEADRGVADYAQLREASCYAFADYLFAKAEGRLEGGNDNTEDDETELPDNGYYTVFSSTDSILAPGVSQKINYAMSADGKQMVYYIATVDVNRDDLTIMANYKDNDPSKGWGMQRVQDQVSALVKNNSDVENFRPVVAINGDGFNTSTGKPGGLLVMKGKEWHPVDGDGFFAILKDGTAMIGTKADYETYKDEIQEAIGAFGATLVKDGKISVNKNSNYYTTRASRTAIGIKADGSVVMMVLDGRQQPFSCGGSMEEIAQIMYEAGCVHAVNLDGGGSTTYMSKPEGSDDIKVINRPSDGYARSVAATLVAVSTAESSDKFDRAIIKSDYDYLTIGTSINMTAIGANNIGSFAEIPEGAYWAVSDESIGTIDSDGVFTATDLGEVEVSLMLDGKSYGSKTLNVVIPDKLEFTEKYINIVYGVPEKLPIKVYYNGNSIAYNENDVFFGITIDEAGSFDGLYFEADEASGVRNVQIGAMIIVSEDFESNPYDIINVSIFKSDEASFDFNDVTAGNRTLAWNRKVLNATTTDGVNYVITNPSDDISFEYTFALDMTAIEMPEKLADLSEMLPGSDTGNASAFNYLLQLAERVSVLTEVRITAQFDKDVVVDLSELKIVNDYFEIKKATVDEENNVTLVCNWIDRTEPIPPETANPVCILTGIKATPSDAGVNDDLVIFNSGSVSYDIYLRASSLYSFVQNPEVQKIYGLYPYTTDKTGYEGGTESGAHFAATYADFEDSFIVDKSVRQGWYKIDGADYYYVDHKALTGVQYIPSKNDADIKLFYEFDETGKCKGACSGVISYNGDLYYAIKGEKTTGWVSNYDAEGNPVNYYFNPKDGKAVNGKQKIGGYNYTFTDYILTRGDLVKDSNGTRYRWAGSWVHGQWFEVDGNWYCTKKYNQYVVTGFLNIQSKDTPDWNWHLFDENGVFQKDFTGLWHIDNDTYYIKNGIRVQEPGLMYIDGYYYYFASNAKAVKNRVYWPTKTNGLLPVGPYQFDEQGRMVNPPATDDTPENPDTPVNPDTPDILNGIVEKDGKYYYYEDGKLKYGAGVKRFTDADGKTFYIYVRSNGQLATGNYWITETNGLLEKKMYDFGTDGKYYAVTAEPEKPDTPVTPETPAVKDGVINENGKWFYYINGVLQKGNGIVKLTDENDLTYYIYVRSDGRLATGVYWPTTRNGLLPRGGYNWGSDGRYYPATIVPDPEPDTPEEPEKPEVKNGVYNENGKYYYYKDGVKQKNKGVIKLTDENGKTFYIYVRSSGELATGKYWPTNRNDLLPRGEYDWGTDGRYYPV